MQVCINTDYQDQESCENARLAEPYVDLNGNGQWDEGSDDETSQDEESCGENQSNWRS